MAPRDPHAMPTPADMERSTEDAGVAKATMPLAKLVPLALLAGIFISFGASFMLVVKADATLSFAASQVLSGFVFSVGLFLVFVAGAELFTGDNLMVMGALSGRYSWARVLRVWIVVYLGNLVGSLAMAALMYLAGFADQASGAVGAVAVTVAATKVGLAPATCFVRGVLCNMLVCLAVWMGFAARSVPAKLLCALMPVAAFVALGFEHCVANMFFLPFGMLVQSGGVLVDAGQITLVAVLQNLALATLGNIVGGALVVGGTYWSVYGRK